MSQIKPLLVANWKMHKTPRQAAAFVQDFAGFDLPWDKCSVALAPSYVALDAVGASIDESGRDIALCAQNVFYEDKGAFTGEVSLEMLAEIEVSYVILGHSERRALFGESNERVARKRFSVLKAGMTPIVCVGESSAEREAGGSEDFVLDQLAKAFEGASKEDVARSVVAYEPIWAIGTGLAATTEEAGAMHGAIGDFLKKEFKARPSHILYGGSSKPENTASFLKTDGVDGLLVGGASLEPESFADMVRAAG